MVYTEKDIKIKKLEEEHLNIISDFRSENKELEDFLKEDAFDNQNNGISSTYLTFLLKDGSLMAYITLLTDRIDFNDELKEIYRKQGINYSYLPALKIGRLCVDDRFRRKNIGTLLIKFSIQRLFKIKGIAGCRIITIDAKKSTNKDDNPIEFYRKNGFIELITEDKNGDTIPMYFDIANLQS